MCDKPGVTSEHVPPKSFFPDDRRVNLITVPSCWTHNVGNSKDVEYVRNVIVGGWGVNPVGEQVQLKAFRSFDNSPKLLRQTFGDMSPIMKDGEETGAFTVNLRRVRKVMRSIASALYFIEFNKTYPFEWWIYGGSLVTPQSLQNLPDYVNEKMRQTLSKVPVSDRHTNQPEVFKYALYEDDEHRMLYRMEFYEGIIFYAYGTPSVKLWKPKIYRPS